MAGNPYVFQSTGENEKEIEYPQSFKFVTLGRGRRGCGDEQVDGKEVVDDDNDGKNGKDGNEDAPVAG